jgi:hypothetical protein
MQVVLLLAVHSWLTSESEIRSPGAAESNLVRRRASRAPPSDRDPSKAMVTIMVEEHNDHSACVNAWMDRSAKGLPPERLIQLFEQGFAAMWRRAHRTLGDVTLTAIADRVLHRAAEQFPTFSALKVDATGLQCKELRERAGSLQHDQLAEGMRFVLVEFLTVLGNLTADVLTPALHSELSKVAPEERGPGHKKSPGVPRNPKSNGEDSEP